MAVRILFVADVVGRPGRMAVREWVPKLKEELALDFVIANGENSAGGLGITPSTAKEIFDGGVDCITTGNHVWHHKEVVAYLEQESRLLRPANFPPQVAGRGWVVMETKNEKRVPVAVINLMGQVFMKPLDCPFRTADAILEAIGERARVIVIDFHAEATSEKQAFARYVDGKVTAVFGTHTHVMTADEQILPKGTAYITDVGMTGPVDSIIGMKEEPVLKHFLTKMPYKFEVASGRAVLSGVVLEADERSGRALSIQRIQRLASQPTGGE